MKKIIKKIYVFILTLMLIIPVIGSNIHVVKASEELSYEVTTEYTDDKLSAKIILKISKDNRFVISNIKQPNDIEIKQEQLIKDKDENILVEYMVDKNDIYSFQVEYTKQGKKLSKTIEHKVDDIKEETIVEKKLTVEAKDVSFVTGKDVNLRGGITVTDGAGANITSTAQFSIKSYGNYNSEKAGLYKITYLIAHPDFKEVVEVSRNVTIQKDTPKLGRSASVDQKVFIELSSLNETLKTPSDYDLGDIKQEVFNIRLRFSVDASTSSRKTVTKLPEGFKYSKVPLKTDLAGVKTITLNDTKDELTLEYNDSIVLDVSFDVEINRDRKLVYELASDAVGGLKSKFVIEGYKNNTEKIDEQVLTLALPEFKEPTYEVKVRQNDYSKSSNSCGLIPYDITIVYDKYTKIDKKLAVILPELVDRNRVKFIDSIILMNDAYIKADEINKIFNMKVFRVDCVDSIGKLYAYDETNLKFQFSISKTLFHNKTYSSTTPITIDSQYISSKKDCGKLIVKPENKTIGKYNLIQTVDKWLYMGNKVNYKLTLSQLMDKGESRLGDLDTTVVFPDEISPIGNLKINGYKSKGRYGYPDNHIDEVQFKIITNKGRTITNSKFEDELLPDEKVKSITVENEGFSDSNYSSLLKEGTVFLSVDCEIANTDASGNPLPNQKNVNITASASSDDTTASFDSKTDSYIIARRTEENAIVYNSDNDRDVLVGTTTDKPLYSLALEGNQSIHNTMLYKNVNFDLEGDEFLSLIDEVTLMMPGKVIYSTNLRNDVTSTYVTLSKGEYFTKLNILIDEIDVYKSNLKVDERLWVFDLNLKKDVPEFLPLDGKTPLDNIDFAIGVNMTADGGVDKSWTYKTPKFFYTQYKEGLEVKDLSSEKFAAYQYTQFSSFNFPFVEISNKGNDSKYPKFIKNAKIDIDIDQKLLGRMTQFSISPPPSADNSDYSNTELYINWEYENGIIDRINFINKERVKSSLVRTSRFKIKKVWIDGNFSSANQFVLHFASSDAKFVLDDYDDVFIGTDYKSYPISATLSGDGIDTYTKDGRTQSVSGLTQSSFSLSYDSRKFTSDKKSVYQGEFFEMSGSLKLNSLGLYRNVSYQNLVFYFEIDERFVYSDRSLIINMSNKNYDINVNKTEFLANKTNRGTSVLKVSIDLLYKLGRGWTNRSDVRMDFSFGLKSRLNAKGGEAEALKEIYIDPSDAHNIPCVGEWAQTVYQQSRYNDDYQIQDDPTVNLGKIGRSVVTVNVLPAVSLGLGSYASLSGTYGEKVKGKSNDIFGQDLSIISQDMQPTKDWYIYIPVPKVGKKANYEEDSTPGILKTSASEYSLMLNDYMDTSLLPSNAEVYYTMDENPQYDLRGANVGNYTDDKTKLDLKNITMIKIYIPELGAKEKYYPKIEYKLEKPKDKVGVINSYGGAYFNFKTGGSDFSYPTGKHTGAIAFEIDDIVISGQVWSETDKISDNILTPIDYLQENVELEMKYADGTGYKTKTDSQGRYSFALPKAGEVTIQAFLPNDLTVKPVQIYEFVEPNKGHTSNSSVVDQKTGKAVIDVKGDMMRLNVGLLPNRTVIAHDVTLLVGEKKNVQSTLFPTYANIDSYSESNDTSIATVSATGEVSATKVGYTTASIFVEDGRGGKIEGIYKIKVISPNAPMATYDDIHILTDDRIEGSKGIEFKYDNGIIMPDDDVTIDESGIDVSKPGKYTLIYNVDDGLHKLTFKRNVYVHGRVEINAPTKEVRVNTQVNPLNGISASYMYTRKDGTLEKKNVDVKFVEKHRTRTTALTRDTAGYVGYEVSAETKVEGLENTATKECQIIFNDYPFINAKDKYTFKVGTINEDKLKQHINATAGVEFAKGDIVLTRDIIYKNLNKIDFTKEGVYKIELFVEDEGKATATKTIEITLYKDVIESNKDGSELEGNGNNKNESGSDIIIDVEGKHSESSKYIQTSDDANIGLRCGLILLASYVTYYFGKERKYKIKK